MIKPIPHTFLVSLTLPLLAGNCLWAQEKPEVPAPAKRCVVTGKVGRRYAAGKGPWTFIDFSPGDTQRRLSGFRIEFHNESGKAEEAYWLTKAGRSITLPPQGLLLQNIPQTGTEIELIFDHDEDVPGVKVALLSLVPKSL